MRPSHRPLVAFLALLSGATAALSAQDAAAAPIILLVPGGTRAFGLGNAFVAGSGPEVVFYNPAQVGSGRGTTLSAQRYGGGSTLGSLATSGALFDGFSYAAGAKYLDFSTMFDAPVRPADLTHRGPVDANSLVATLAVATSWKGLRWGIAGKYASERLSEGTSSAVAVDLGAGYRLGRISLGLAAQDLGSDILVAGTRVDLPSRVTLGAMLPDQYLSTYFDIAGSVALTRNRDGQLVPGGGVELTWNPVSGVGITGRVGLRRVPGGAAPGESPVTFGATLGIDRYALDLAWEPARGPGGGSTERVGLRIQPLTG